MSNHIVEYQQDGLIFDQGSEGQEAYIVLSGSVGILKQNGDGRGHLLHRIEPGGMFGELAVINATRRSAAAIALDDHTTIMAVDRARFLYLVGQHPGFAVMVMETLSRWLTNGAPSSAGPSATSQLTSRIKPGATCTAVQLAENIWQFRARSRSCNSYVFKGRKRTILVDPGLDSDFDGLAACLNEIGLSVDAVDTVILTHEHFDHISATPRLTGRRAVAAHALTAHKIASNDELTIQRASFAAPPSIFEVDITLADGSVVDTGDHQISVICTPGHSSGCICLLEKKNGLLVTGDTILANGVMGGVFGSGSISDTIYSLELLKSLRSTQILPGHGPCSTQPDKDLERALHSARSLLSDTRRVVEVLNTQESINKILLSLRDLNR